MLNRNTAPRTQKIQQIDFIRPKEIGITDTVKLLWMENVPNQTSRIDLYFDAGLRKDRNIIVTLCSSLLLSGTHQKSSTEIHDQMDHLGAYFDIGLSHEGLLISIYALKTNIYEAFQIICDAIENAVFPEEEIKEKIHEKREKYKISATKVEFIAQRKFQEKIFHNSPYNELTNLIDFDTVTRNEIVSFHEESIKKGLYKVAIVGSLEENEVLAMVDRCKKYSVQKELKYFGDFCNEAGIFHMEKDAALQSAIRIGKTMFNKTHEDFFDFSILNTILGDYFGSRLMKNIREDKGYTYGIGSTLAETGSSGYFIIGSEVGIKNRESSLQEIEKEMNFLCEKTMDKGELELVQNYLLGQMLKSADGPYSMMDLYLSVDAYALDMDFYNKYIERIHQINPDEIKTLSQKYLKWDTMSVVSAG